MITLTYTVDPAQKDAEIQWLNDQKIYPSTQNFWKSSEGNLIPLVRIGMIISPEAATIVKLHHKVEHQQDYKQR